MLRVQTPLPEQQVNKVIQTNNFESFGHSGQLILKFFLKWTVKYNKSKSRKKIALLKIGMLFGFIYYLIFY